MVELAFFRAFLAWEAFLEESFILFMLGQPPPRGRSPFRYAFPPNRQAAIDWVAEGNRYAKWTNAGAVSSRAERFFRDGRPYALTLRGNQNVFDELCTIRNAVAHSSMSAQDKFENLVRNKMGIVPPGVTVGSFLGITVLGSTPPTSFLEHYLEKIEFSARQIVSS